MPDQNFDQNQDSWVQSGGNANREGLNQQQNQQSWSSQQGGQTGQEPWGTQPNIPGNQYPQSGNQPGEGGILGGGVHAVRQDVESQMGGLIDHYANQVPGGARFAPEAKQALSGVLNSLQNQLENDAKSRMGGMGGSLFGNNQNNSGNSGGQL